MPPTQHQQQRPPDFLVRIADAAAFLHRNREVPTLRSNRVGALAEAEKFLAAHAEIAEIACNEARTSRAARAGRTTRVGAALRSELVRVASVHARRECEIPLPDVLFVATVRWMRIEQRELAVSSADVRPVMSAAGQLFGRAKVLPRSFAEEGPLPSPTTYDRKWSAALAFTSPVLGHVVPDRVRNPVNGGAVETYSHFLKHVMQQAVQEVVHNTGQKTKDLEASLTKTVRFWTAVYLRESKGKEEVPPLRLVLEAATARWVAGNVGINWRLRNNELTEIIVALYHGDIRDRLGYMNLAREVYREELAKQKSKTDHEKKDEAKEVPPVTRAYDLITSHIQTKRERHTTYGPILELAAALDVIGQERATVSELIDEPESLGNGYTARVCAAATEINRFLVQTALPATVDPLAPAPRDIRTDLTYCFRLIDSCNDLRGLTGFPADTDTLGLLASASFPEPFIAELRWMDNLRHELSAPPKMSDGLIKDFVQRHRRMQAKDPDYVNAAAKLAHAGYKVLPTPRLEIGPYTAQLVRHEAMKPTRSARDWDERMAAAKSLDNNKLAAVDVLNAVDGKFERTRTIETLLTIAPLYTPHLDSPSARVMARGEALKTMVTMQSEGRLTLNDVQAFLDLEQGQSGGLIAKANFVNHLLIAGSYRNQPSPPATVGVPSISGLDRLLSQAKREFHPANTKKGRHPCVQLMDSVLHMHDPSKGRSVEGIKATIGSGGNTFDCSIVATFEPRALRDSFGLESKVARRIAVVDVPTLSAAIGMHVNGSAGHSSNGNGLYAKLADKCFRANCIPVVLIHSVEDEGKRYQLIKKLEDEVLGSVLEASREGTVPTFVYRQYDGYVVANLNTIDYGAPDRDVVEQVKSIRL